MCRSDRSDRSDRHGHRAAALGGVDGLAVVLGQTAPHPVRLAHRECVLTALGHDGAGGADGLGCGIAVPARRPALALGVEEQRGVRLTARAAQLPLPQIRHRSGKPRDLCHRSPPSSAPCPASLSLRPDPTNRFRCSSSESRHTLFNCRSSGRSSLSPTSPGAWRCTDAVPGSRGGVSSGVPRSVATHTCPCNRFEALLNRLCRVFRWRRPCRPRTIEAMAMTDRGDDGSPTPPPMLTVAAVARRLGVAPSTLRTWDRRYNLGPSAHTAGSHRRYSPQDLARLVVMRRLTLDGVPPADAARIVLAHPLDEASAVPAAGSPESGPDAA